MPTDPLARLIDEAAFLAGGVRQCARIGHSMEFTGGATCGCKDGQCSVPVHTCRFCGDSDYGDNAEAVAIRAACRAQEGHPDV